MITPGEFSEILKMKGWVKFPGLLSVELIAQLNEDLEKAYQTCRSIQLRNGVDLNTDGTVHHLLGQADSFLEIFKRDLLQDYIKQYFDQSYILNSYGGVINMKNRPSYVGSIHRDIRRYYSVPMMINMLIMLDDFTPENGATYFLPGSNLNDTKPGADFFYTHAERAVGNAGDIILFDSLLWHAAGENTTDKVRRALTLTFSRPFVKQQLDYPRVLGYDKVDEFSEELRQVIGYNSRVPANLDEWYQPPHKRFYKPGQE